VRRHRAAARGAALHRSASAGLAALAAALGACAGERFDAAALEARYPELRALAPHPLDEARPYALPLAGALTLFLCRWPSGASIPVSIAADASPAQREALAAALAAWEGAGLGVRFAPGEGPLGRAGGGRVLGAPAPHREQDPGATGAAGIRVRLRDDFVTGQADTAADCAVEGPPGPADALVPGARLVAASIHLARADPHPRLTLLHELGHALGFQGHAPRGRTLMLARESEVLERARRVTAGGPLEDAGLRALYAVPSGSVVARVALGRAQTLPADRIQALAAERGLAGPFARVGDREGLLWWADAAGRRLALRIEGAGRALRHPAALRLVPASREAEALLGPAAPRAGAP
jgi:hypothetical protein